MNRRELLAGAIGVAGASILPPGNSDGQEVGDIVGHLYIYNYRYTDHDRRLGDICGYSTTFDTDERWHWYAVMSDGSRKSICVPEFTSLVRHFNPSYQEQSLASPVRTHPG